MTITNVDSKNTRIEVKTFKGFLKGKLMSKPRSLKKRANLNFAKKKVLRLFEKMVEDVPKLESNYRRQYTANIFLGGLDMQAVSQNDTYFGI